MLLDSIKRYKNKRGDRPIKQDVEIDISNESGFSKELPTIDQEMDSYFNSRKTTEDYLPEDETLRICIPKSSTKSIRQYCKSVMMYKSFQSNLMMVLQ